MIIEKIKKNKYFMYMFKSGDIVKVLIPNVINTGYDYKLTSDADIGAFVRCTVMNRQYIGVIIGPGDSNLEISKIKPIIEVCDLGLLSQADIKWIHKMSEWTLMSPGAVLRLIINVPDAFNPPRVEQLYAYNFEATGKMTDSRQAVCDAFQSNDNEPMSVIDIQNIAHVSSAVVKNMIKSNFLVPVDTREKSNDAFNYSYFDTKSVVLNDEQQSVADIIADSINKNEFSVFLLDGFVISMKEGFYFVQL